MPTPRPLEIRAVRQRFDLVETEYRLVKVLYLTKKATYEKSKATYEKSKATYEKRKAEYETLLKMERHQASSSQERVRSALNASAERGRRV
ncbi:hypothetical protein HYALB_00003814 [Hymenoscyphus albidus]|uniref:Uncharacterized protein n=1 Tax=Hymenoscyphus albidus TaxID=595503 RepID=A0A9N9Q5W2_9HELO|nr:hypothetical protein HYALB_00003814 [Hymenoscyphus albidus]